MTFQLRMGLRGSPVSFCIYPFLVIPLLFTAQASLADSPESSAGAARFVSTYTGTGMPGNAAEHENRHRAAMAEPYGLVCDQAGNLYFSDYENNRVRRVDADSGEVTTAAEVPAPQGLALDRHGGLYVGSMYGVVWKVELHTGTSGVVAGGGTAQIASGPATAMALGAPTGIQVDSTGDVYIADESLHAVFRLTPSTGQLTVVAGERGQRGFAGDGGLATQARLSSPADVEIDKAGNLYIADADNHVVRYVSAESGMIRTLSGTPTSKGFAGDGGSGHVQFNWPQDLLLFGEDRLLIADVFNHRIRELHVQTGVVATLAGSGSYEPTGENVSAATASLPYPVAIAANPSGTLYVSSPREHRVFQIGAPSVIPRPWWLSPWSWLAAIGVFGSLLYGIADTRARQLRARAHSLEREVERRTADLVRQNETVERQAKQLRELAEVKDQVLARISHEFRTPLTLILGPLGRIRELASSPEERRYLESAKSNASRLLRLVNQTLELARIGAGSFERPSPVLAAPIFEQVVASFESLAEDRGIALAIERADALVLLSTADAFETIAVNLVSNAIKYTQVGGRVSVSLYARERMGVLSVADSGRGIEDEYIERIFEPFERAHDEAERIPGSGLGLAVVREIVDVHDGRVEVDSSPGEGSTFQVLLPLAGGAPGEHPDVSAHEATDAQMEVAALRGRPSSVDVDASGDKGSPMALIVEDNADMRRYLVDVLRPHYRCLQADDGRSAVRLAIAEVPDIVVSDIMLPGQDGYAICRQLKDDARTSHVPVVLLTALGDPDYKMRGLDQQADDYVAKPFDEAELLLRLHNLLELRKILQARYARDLRFDRATPSDLRSQDRAFLAKLGSWIAERYQDPGLELGMIAAAMASSDRQMQRKLKALIGLSPSEFLRDYRLQRAQEQLVAGGRPGRVASDCGFVSHPHFTACFKAQFGYPPSQARDRMRGTV